MSQPIEQETYMVEYRCVNCFRRGSLEILKGCYAKEFIKNQQCPNCGCSTLQQGKY